MIGLNTAIDYHTVSEFKRIASLKWQEDSAIKRVEAVEEWRLAESSTTRKRMQLLPNVKFEGRKRLDESHPLVRKIHEMIGIRNRLVHYEAPTLTFTEKSEAVKFAKDGEDPFVKIPPPQDPWRSLSPEQVTTYSGAVMCYINEVCYGSPEGRSMLVATGDEERAK